MASPLFNIFGGGNKSSARNNANGMNRVMPGGNNMAGPFAMVTQFMDFARNFHGDAQAECQKYMEQLAPEQVEQAKELATQMQSMLNGFMKFGKK